MNNINLANLGKGAAIEKFDEELEKAIANILDPNTDPRAKREVILKVTIKPAKDRTFGSVAVTAEAKLAPSEAFSTRAFFGAVEGRSLAFEDNPAQVTIDEFLAPNTGVTEIKKALDEQEQSK